MPKHDPDTWMWERAQSLLEQADRLARRFGQVSRTGQKPVSWEPPVDMFESAGSLWILVALPGVGADKAEIRVDGARLIVSGERTLPEPLRHAALLRMEIPQGLFQREIELPRGRFQLESTELVAGCLSIHLRKVL